MSSYRRLVQLGDEEGVRIHEHLTLAKEHLPTATRLIEQVVEKVHQVPVSTGPRVLAAALGSGSSFLVVGSNRFKPPLDTDAEPPLTQSCEPMPRKILRLSIALDGKRFRPRPRARSGILT